MHYVTKNGILLVRLERGEELVTNINKLAKQLSLPGAWLHGLGGASSATLGFYNLESKTYRWQEFTDLMEVTSLQGNLSWADGEPLWHIHGTFSRPDFTALGGHVKEITVGATCELGIHVWQGDRLLRKHDALTGLRLLEF